MTGNPNVDFYAFGELSFNLYPFTMPVAVSLSHGFERNFSDIIAGLQVVPQVFITSSTLAGLGFSTTLNKATDTDPSRQMIFAQFMALGSDWLTNTLGTNRMVALRAGVMWENSDNPMMANKIPATWVFSIGTQSYPLNPINKVLNIPYDPNGIHLTEPR